MTTPPSPRRAFVLGALLLLGLSLGACEQRGGSDAAADSTVAATPVSVRTLAAEEFRQTLRLNGSTQARREVEIAAKLPGTVASFPAELGDRLAKGELILSLDLRPFETALAQAEAGLLAAEAAAAQAARELERARELKARERISDAELESVTLAERQAESARRAAAAGLEQARLQLEDARVLAPFAGRLAAKHVDAHEQVAPGMPVAALADLAQVRVRCSVSEQDVARLAAGQPATLSIPALGEARFPGALQAVGVRADPLTRSYAVEIVADNPGERMLSGMAARVEVEIARRPGAILIPGDAVVEQYGQPVAFVVEAGLARRRALTLGPTDGERVLVEAGLAAGDQLIVQGQWSARDGQPVALRETAR